MLNNKGKQKERSHLTKAEKKTEEIRAKVEKILEKLEQIEVEETWTKTWRTHRKQKSQTEHAQLFANKCT